MSMQSWLVGGAADCDIVVDSAVVSYRHCRLLQDDEGNWFLDDLNSTNGTFVNGRLISSRTGVSPADRLTLGRDTSIPWPSTPPARTQFLVLIGRDSANDVVLDYPTVSLRHAMVRAVKTGTVIEDLKSSNGTFVGARTNRVTASPLLPTDTVFFGSLKVATQRLFRAGAASAQPQPTMLDLSRRSQVVLGRDPHCDHVLDFPMISWHHARIWRREDGLFVNDLGSSNGTFVNGHRITKTTALKAGDVVGLGSFTFTLNAAGTLYRRNLQGNISMQADHVSVAVSGKRLLHDVSFSILPSEFVGLMGLSGAGKSTLINALNGYSAPTNGRILFNGADLYEHYDQFRGQMGFVPQDDIIHPDLTVGEALYFNARLRLPSDFSDAGIRHRIDSVLTQLGLGGTEDVLIGSPEKRGISGGQRKRVNLAMELLSDPSVLFLDEPTSGLSSEDALVVMRLLRELADNGKTILLTIHQPSLEVFRLLDNLVVLTKDAQSDGAGRLAYYGPAYPDSLLFFNPQAKPNSAEDNLTNPDHVLRGLAGRSSAEWLERYRSSDYEREYVSERSIRDTPLDHHAAPKQLDRANGFLPWLTLVRRGTLIKFRDRFNSATLLLQAPIIAMLIALVFGKQAGEKVTGETWSSAVGATGTSLFLLVLSAIWFGCSNAARDIVGEWAVYRRERMVNLGLGAYIGAKFAVLGAVCVVQCALLLGIVYWCNGLQGSWLALYVTLLLAAAVGVGIGLTVSALARSSEMAIACLPIIILPMVILGGILQPLSEMSDVAKLAAQVMPSRWAFESVFLVEAEAKPKRALATAPSKAEGPISPAGSAETAVQRDMAEACFPSATERMGIRACNVALLGMALVLTIAIGVILRSRDIQ